jgi:hypothetical protein
VRIGKLGFRARIKGNFHIEFGEEHLTSFAGLELVRQFLRLLKFSSLLRTLERRVKLGGDLRLSTAVLLFLGMLIVGGRRLRHIRFLRDDPMLLRFAGVNSAPDERTLSRMLKRLGYKTWPHLDDVNTSVVEQAMTPLNLRRITLDIDGSVLTTGLKVGGAMRGFNPHHRKNPSYFPIMATIAQTGHVLAHKNRYGNVHDSRQSEHFLRHSVRMLRKEARFGGIIELRTDSAFFQREFFKACDSCGIEYAIRVPMFPWLNLRSVVKQKLEQDWKWVDRKRGVQGLFAELPIKPWKRTERIAIYRKSVNHAPAKSRQLDLFNPDDGYWEYSVVATNKSLQLRALYDFTNGHGAQEKVIGELKSGFAFDAIPTNSYRANTAWQKLNILAYNLTTSLQLATTATPRRRSLRRTARFVLKSIRSLRVEWLNRAARVIRPGGRNVLRLAYNDATAESYSVIEGRLRDAA